MLRVGGASGTGTLRDVADAVEAPVITRRAALAAALGSGAGAALAGRAAAAEPAAEPTAAPTTADVPLTLTAPGGPGTPTTPGFPVDGVGVSWSGPRDGGSVRFRTADGWGAWRPLPHGCGTARDGAPDRCGALAAGGGALGYEVAPPAGAADVAVTAINTTDGPPVGRAAPSRDGLPTGPGAPAGLRRGFRYYSRAAWGADESLRFGADGAELFPAAYHPVQALTVHHTATDPGTDHPEHVRSLHRFLTVDRGFGDMGYHLLIDPDGALYEGRWSGADPFPVFGEVRDGVPLANNAAHVGGFNAGNVGVALLGDLTAVQPTAAARRTLTRVLAVLAAVTGIDPLGTVGYVNPISGATRTVDAISGHRDWLATECPGEAFHPELPAVRRDVAALLGRTTPLP